jgi:glycosyltransferase involved in cell wall biosynthesis
MLTIWFHRGQTILNQTLQRAFEEKGHEVFIHARMGAVYGQNKQERERYGWREDNVTFWPEYNMRGELSQLIDKLKEQEIDLVIFNEEYDIELVRVVKQAGFKVASYVDYIHKDWINGKVSYFPTFDLLLCATHRAYDMVNQFAPTKHIGWGIPEDYIVDYPWEKRPYLFFLNAGWVGINDRKGLNDFVNVIHRLVNKYPEAANCALIHCQLGVDARQVSGLGLDVMCGTMNLPGLYHMAKVYLYPAKLDGLGLSMLEAMANEMVVVCPDAPPWNEFLTHDVNGFLLPIAETKDRDDGIAFPEVYIDREKLFETIENIYLGRCNTSIDQMADNAFFEKEEKLDWFLFCDCVNDALKTVGGGAS